MNRKERRARGKQAGPDAGVLNDFGVRLAGQGRLAEAVRAYNQAIAADKNFAAAYCNLGDALDALGRPSEAVAAYAKAVAAAPDFLNGFYNLGVTLARLGRWDEAASCYRRAVEIEPGFAQGHANLAAVLVETGGVAEAEICAQRAVAIAPDFGLGWHNLGLVLYRQRRLDEAEACYRRALALPGVQKLFEHNLAILLLTKGEMAAGWALYEARFEVVEQGVLARPFAQPRWRGEAGAGRMLLIHAEQGFGDTLQFCRYASLARARGWLVVMEVQKPLARLLRGLAGADVVVAAGEALPAFDAQIPMMSVPGVFANEIPPAPYVQADAAEVAAWGAKVDAVAGGRMKVGVVWAGSKRESPALAAVDARRSMAPEILLPVLRVPGVQFFSLQKDQNFVPPADVEWADLMDGVADFADTAALIANLDLVIAVDTSVAHLAGAMGKKIWLLNRFDSCWRWGEGRRDSPWYPSLRIYGQSQPGDWAGVVAAVAADLAALVGGGNF